MSLSRDDARLARCRGGRLLRRAAGGALLALLAVAYCAPILFLVAGSLKPDGEVLREAATPWAWIPRHPSLANYRDVFARVDFARFFLNSVVITSAVVVAGLAVNSLAGYALARLRWRGRRLCLAATLALLVIPFEAIAVPLFYQVTVAGGRDTYLAQILPFVANPFFIALFHTFFRELPRELEEAARTDGAGPLRTFIEIVVPNARPAFATVAILSFLVQWSSFLWPLLVTSGPRVRPLPVALASFHTLPPLQWGDILAFGVLMIAPVVLVFAIFQRSFIRGVAAAGIKG